MNCVTVAEIEVTLFIYLWQVSQTISNFKTYTILISVSSFPQNYLWIKSWGLQALQNHQTAI